MGYDGLGKIHYKGHFSLILEDLENGILRIPWILFGCQDIIAVNTIISSVYRRSFVNIGCINIWHEYLGLIILLKLARQNKEMW